jgi:hypothetical protein
VAGHGVLKIIFMSKTDVPRFGPPVRTVRMEWRDYWNAKAVTKRCCVPGFLRVLNVN